MIYNSHLEQTLEFFCKENNIRMVNGKVYGSENIAKVEKFLQRKLSSDRNCNRRIEEDNHYSVRQDIEKFIGKIKILESPIEQFLFEAIVTRGLEKHCRPQFEIGKYRVDLAFPMARLAVECDGKQYHFTDQAQIEKDQIRDKYLARKGWRVLHIEGLAIRRNLNLCLEKIESNLRGFIPEVL